MRSPPPGSGRRIIVVVVIVPSSSSCSHERGVQHVVIAPPPTHPNNAVRTLPGEAPPCPPWERLTDYRARGAGGTGPGPPSRRLHRAGPTATPPSFPPSSCPSICRRCRSTIHHSRKIRINCCHKHSSRFMTVAKFPSCQVLSSRFMTIHDTPQGLQRDLLPVGDMLSNALNFLALLPAAPLGWIACCLRIRGRSSAAQQNPSTSSQTYVIGPTTSSRAVDLHVRTDIEEAAMMRETRGE